MMRSRVLLPQPLLPTMLMNSPSLMDRLMSCRAVTSPAGI